MRGKGFGDDAEIAGIGITPAYAGKRFTSWQTTAFPRGSPPPMRGKAQSELFWFVHFGITPAYAGKSLTQPHNAVLTGDHPRLCGEK